MTLLKDMNIFVRSHMSAARGRSGGGGAGPLGAGEAEDRAPTNRPQEAGVARPPSRREPAPVVRGGKPAKRRRTAAEVAEAEAVLEAERGAPRRCALEAIELAASDREGGGAGAAPPRSRSGPAPSSRICRRTPPDAEAVRRRCRGADAAPRTDGGPAASSDRSRRRELAAAIPLGRLRQPRSARTPRPAVTAAAARSSAPIVPRRCSARSGSRRGPGPCRAAAPRTARPGSRPARRRPGGRAAARASGRRARPSGRGPSGPTPRRAAAARRARRAEGVGRSGCGAGQHPEDPAGDEGARARQARVRPRAIGYREDLRAPRPRRERGEDPHPGQRVHLGGELAELMKVPGQPDRRVRVQGAGPDGHGEPAARLRPDRADRVRVRFRGGDASRSTRRRAATEAPSREGDEDLGAAAAGRHDHGPRRPRQDLAARLHPQGERRGRRGRRHHAAHRRLPRHTAERPRRSPSSTPRATRPSPPCAPAAPRSPTSSCWWSRPTTRSCRRRSRRSATPGTPACR